MLPALRDGHGLHGGVFPQMMSAYAAGEAFARGEARGMEVMGAVGEAENAARDVRVLFQLG